MNWFKELPKEQVALISALAAMAVTYLVFGPSCSLFLSPFAVGVVGYTYLRTWSNRRHQSSVASEMVARRELAATDSEPRGETHPSAHFEAISNPGDSGLVIESTITMDGAICMRASDGSVLIKKRNLRNWVVLLTLVSFVLIFGVAAAAVLVLGRSLVTGESLDVLDRVGSGCLLSSLMTAFSVPILLLGRSILRPQIYIDVVRKVLEVGRGTSMRHIPFSSISHIAAQPLLYPFQSGATAIVAVLEDDVQQRLGTVSGNREDAIARVGAIAQWIATATGAEWRWEHPQ